MSEMEYHTGTLRDITREDISLEEQAKEILNKKGILEIESYHDSWIEQFRDIMYRDYTFIIIGDKMFEFIKHEELDIDDLGIITQNKEGDYEFMVSFYNGSCGFDEALEDLINES